MTQETSEAEASRAVGARFGVRSLLFLVLGIGSVLPVTLLGLNQAERWTAHEMASADRETLAAVRSAADQVSSAMLGHVHDSESFAAQVATLPRLERSLLQPVIDAHVAHHPEFLGAYVADAQGKSLVHESAARQFFDGGIEYADRDYYREIVRTGKTAISRVQVGRITKVLSVNVASPIRDALGVQTGLTCSSIDLSEITRQAQATVRGMVGGRVVIVDAEGHEIADSSRPVALEPKDVSRALLFAELAPGRVELRQGLDERGLWVRGAAAGLSAPVAQWRVIASVPQTIVDAHARQVRNQTIVLSLALVVAALLLSAALAARLARPLRLLAATADAVRRSELVSLPRVMWGAPRELAQLTRAIAAMVRRLQDHAHNLEHLVVARTEQLSKTNTALESAFSRIKDNERRIYEDIEKARLFQERMLPDLPRIPGLDLAVHYAPLERVSGDIYDVTLIAPDRLRVFLADATGHGVQASMRTIVLKAAYDRLRPLHADPASLLGALNAYLVDEFPDGDLHCTACCLDIVLGASFVEVVYANGGNPPLFVFSPEGGHREAYAEGPLLGAEHLTWPAPDTLKLEPGELLLVCSDGLSEQPNPHRARFDSELSALRIGTVRPTSAAVSALTHAFATFRGDQAVSDDVTLICVRVLAAAERG